MEEGPELALADVTDVGFERVLSDCMKWSSPLESCELICSYFMIFWYDRTKQGIYRFLCVGIPH